MKPINLNGNWSFLPSADRILPFDNDPWESVTIPASLTMYPVWYRREFEMPPNDDCSVWWLECQGISRDCEIWINGNKVGDHQGGFTRFRLDVTNFLQMGTNQLLIRVFSSHSQGIWGDVQLTPYDCQKAPQADDWYLPAAKPILHRDGHWWRGDAPYFLRMINYNPSQPIGVEQLAKDLQLIQEAHFNTIYLNYSVLPKAFYDLCTRLGLFVWQNIPEAMLESDALPQVREMVLQLRHHPCIITWGLHTENPIKHSLAEAIRQLDPYRELYLFETEMAWAWDEVWRVRDSLASSSHPAHLQVGYNHKNEAVYKEWVETLRWHKHHSVSGVIHSRFINTIPSQMDAVNGIVSPERIPNDGYNLAKFAMQPLSPIAFIPLDWYKALPLDQELSFEVGVLNDLPEYFPDWGCRISLTSWIPSEELGGGENTYLYHWRHTFERFNIEACRNLLLGSVTIPPAKRRKAQYQLVLQLYDTQDEHAPMRVNLYLLQPA